MIEAAPHSHAQPPAPLTRRQGPMGGAAKGPVKRPVRGLVLALAALLAAGGLAACSSSGGGGSAKGGSLTGNGALHIGVFELAQAGLIDQAAKGFETELKAQLPKRKISFDVQNAQGDPSLVSSIASTFASSGDDAFAVIGTSAAIALAKQVKTKPIFSIAMSDPVGAKVAKSLEAPGGNVTGSTDYVDPATLLKPIMSISPAPKRIGTIYNPSDQNMQMWIKGLHSAASAYPGLSIVESTVSGTADVSAAARSLLGRADAILVGPDSTVFAGLAAIGGPALSNKLPLYVCGGDPTVAGVLASIGPNYTDLGKIAADGAQKVFTGTPVGQVPFAQPSGVAFTVNKKTLDSLGITLPPAIAKTATIQ